MDGIDRARILNKQALSKDDGVAPPLESPLSFGKLQELWAREDTPPNCAHTPIAPAHLLCHHQETILPKWTAPPPRRAMIFVEEPRAAGMEEVGTTQNRHNSE